MTRLFGILGFILLFQFQALATETICDVKNFGAKGDGTTKDTVAIQAAIDKCAGTGGVVDLQDGVFLSGMIRLKSNLTFRIGNTATLKGSQDDGDYPDTHPNSDNSQLNNCRKTLVYAEGVQNITIEGGGMIDGNGNTPKWIGPASVHPERTRPMAIFIVQSTNVILQNFSMKDAAMWGIVTMESDNVLISHLNIHTPLSGTRDGIDVVDDHHVVIENNSIFSEDDSICLKSGTARGVVDVIVRNNHVLQSTVANGLKMGTASSGVFKDISFENNLIENVDKAAMAVESVDGAAISNISFKHIDFHHAGTAFFILLGKRGNPPQVGSIDGVSFEDIHGDQMKHSWGSIISGTTLGQVTYSVKNISFNNVHLLNQGGLSVAPSAPPEYDGRYPDPNLWGNLPASGYFLRHVQNISFQDSSNPVAQPDVRPALLQSDVHGFRLQP